MLLLIPEGLMHFKMIMFGAPIIFIIISGLIYRSKFTLTEEEHARIVKELESKWSEMNK